MGSKIFGKFKLVARKKAFLNRSKLKWDNNQQKGEKSEYKYWRGELKELKPRILVLGVGGAGGNAINAMIEAGMEGVSRVCCSKY